MGVLKRAKFAAGVLLLLSLGTVGIGYGLWKDVLTIGGAVDTGNVDGEWLKTFCGDFEIDKDVGRTTGEISAADPGVLLFRIENGYPGYVGDCQVWYIYTGSIPAHVEAITFVPGTELNDCTLVQSPSTGSFVATCDELIVTWADGLCTQMHQGDFQGSSLEVEILQEAGQTSVYEFTVEVQLNQFNESRCP